MCCYNKTINRRCRHTFSEPSFPFLIDINWPRCFLSFIKYWSSSVWSSTNVCIHMFECNCKQWSFYYHSEKGNIWLFRSVHHALNVRSVPLNRANSEFHKSVSKNNEQVLHKIKLCYLDEHTFITAIRTCIADTTTFPSLSSLIK